MINESGNSSIVFAEAKGTTAPEKADPQRDTMVSECSIKFHADGPSESGNDPNSVTSIPLRIESENPRGVDNHNPRGTAVTEDSIVFTHEVHTAASADDIHFDAVEDPAASSMQSVRFQVEDGNTGGNGAVDRGTSPQQSAAPANRTTSLPSTQAKPRPTASGDSTAVAEAEKNRAAAGTAAEDAFAAYPPPRRLSQRAVSVARTPRSNGAAPTTPHSRSPNNSYRPAPNPRKSAPVDEAATADPNAKDDAAAVVASVATPASPNIVVTNHSRTFRGAGWAAVVETSRDTIERTVGTETAEAVGVETQFMRVTSIEADAEGMRCDMSIGHAPGQTAEQIDEAIEKCGYENTLRLLDFAAGHEKPSQARESEEAEKQPPSVPFSFSDKVGEGLIELNYSVFPFGSYRHLELSFDGPIAAVTPKFVKECLSGYLGVHESQLVVRRGEEVLSDDVTGADLKLANGCTLEAQCTIPQQQQQEAPQNPVAEEEPQQTAPTPTPAPRAKKATAAKKKTMEAAATSQKKKTSKKDANGGDAATPAKTKTKAKKAAVPVAKAERKKNTAAKPKASPQQPRHTTANGSSPAPHYAAPTRAATTKHNATPQQQQQISTAHSRVHKTPLPRVLTTPRVYRGHSPRPGAESLEEGETMAMYMSASRSPSRDGTQVRSSRPSMGRRSPAATPSMNGAAADSQSVGRSPGGYDDDGRGHAPPQHTVRGVSSVNYHPRPVVQPATRQPELNGHSEHEAARDAVEHHAAAHTATTRLRSPPQPALGVDNSHSTDDHMSDDQSENESVNYNEENLVMTTNEPEEVNFVVEEEEEDVEKSKEDSFAYDYSREPQELNEEEDPVPDAAPNPFV
ncbi:hypothetical protein ABB37_05367 [Leptomonas pyrrhocoris]|uniref:Flagellar attachment zone protein 1 conserved domain-containing protein n=1 Tax=Leptomonas pyrrhocoris TaxID=157538 RepID=A0A0N0VF30_LEPPY|nr:hypothetical protein ABB37_05367 [Leptomonas pyrrhocoris]XP_015657990.1 hypothetical protein ABB37_05367 [Leptomonas pyrrhocoris]KPA79550.1 hypothetical protein ABB37_05367 [Leptomonas pyrrhocoris]KPA79551.1 hypothetical protein ABB37_05367 [Leptomonas pyrrhocoris]|eukprot:XP_015657989.1 hypothetical protein ABB37_05367 [Leptomonas pyrrhocoris]